MHLQNLWKFNFDSVLMPWNWFAANHNYYRRDFDETLVYCREKGIAVQTIKGIARGAWAAGAEKTRMPWYQPLEDENAIRQSVHWVLGEPDIFLNSVGDVDLLPAVLKAAAEGGEPPDAAAMTALEERAGLTTIFGL